MKIRRQGKKTKLFFNRPLFHHGAIAIARGVVGKKTHRNTKYMYTMPAVRENYAVCMCFQTQT